MSDPYQIKAGQVGKVLRFQTGLDLTGAAVSIRVRRGDGVAQDIYPAVINLVDNTAADLTLVAGMFDVDETVNIDVQAVWPGGKIIRGDQSVTFEIGELKLMEKGGRGLMLIDLEAKDQLAGAAAYTRSVKIEGIGRGGKAREETLEIRSLNNAKVSRAKKGKVADLGFKPNRVTRVE